MTISKILCALLLISSHAMAFVGAGLHWGFDFSTALDDTETAWGNSLGESTDLDFLADLGISQDNLGDFADLHPAYISIANFERSPINFGGKVYVDPPLVPFAVELSMNFGTWLYDGSISYINPEEILAYGGDSPRDDLYEELVLDDGSYFGIDETPYGKLHLDLTIKRDMRLPIISPQIGIGPSLHFETPVLSADLIEDAVGDIDDLQELVQSNPSAARDDILDEITDGAKEPKMGMHFLLGLSVSPPVIPLGVYVDGKYHVVFNNDDYETDTNGLLLNAGLQIGF
ncbi:hypothetical protein [Chitinivibrio alkaliphilus]|uniref:Outer membrane protein beta-barrel domain-containing protein n=1 Tax=Chitinivibrio alkaliphilus ACht1 TaxID=1313304 RepID=U7DAS8_9BACT|nr:hypothetical protein [Chitinivibrio alkaliphilus]ERP31505.1 hypothetical protein CALK_1549 [Chitinivibrio alkaliphilus ACht1]